MPLSKKVMKLVIFTALLVVLLRTLSTTLELKRLDGLYYTTQSFYSQPDDTVEVVFLGTSVMFGGIIPTELYENYGICSFNLGSSVQPILASYYWLLESEKYHSDTLSTVVLDVSSLRGNNVEDRYKMAFSEMKYSEHKLLAIHDITDTLNDFLNFSVPLFSFHTRWKELVITDINLNINDNRTFTSR